MAARRLGALYERLPVPLQNAAVAAAGWRSYRHRFGAPFRRALAELEANDARDAAAVRADQARRLRATVAWAVGTVPYYERLFREANVDPASIRGVEDLARLPPLDKETLRARGTELLSRRVPRRHTVSGHSSGSTGTAVSLRYTREALAWEYAVNWRQRGWHGIRLGDRYAAFGGQTVVPLGQREPPFWRYDRPRRRMLFSLYHMTPANLARYAEELARPGYRFWQGYPSSIGLVASWMLEHGFELGRAAPRAVFTSSESLLDFQRDAIERATGAPVADRYGHAEFAVSAVECPQGAYHVDTEFCAVEIDPHEEGPGWVRGEVLATGFANRALPLLRYRTGDVATLRREGGCACGRARPVLERIDGRIEDFVVTPEGRRVGRMDHVFKDALQVKEAQIHQPSRERIVVRLVARPGFDAAARSELDRELRSRLGNALRIDYELVDAIPRLANGKFRAVVSELEEGRTASPPGSPGDAGTEGA